MPDADHDRDEDLAAFNVSTLIANRFRLRVTPHSVRIAFAEGFGGAPPVYHSAVIMPLTDAIRLVEMLTGTVAKLELAMAAPQGRG